MDSFNPQGFLERLRAMAQVDAASAPTQTPAPVRDEQRRRGRLVRAGIEDEAMIDALADAARPPIVAGHVGSRAGLEGAEAFLRDPTRRCLTLAGPTGTGKTWAAAWIVAATDGAVWLSCHEQRSLEQWSATLAHAQRAALVVVNDLGAEADWLHTRLSGLICSRQEAGRRTVITTNLVVDVGAFPESARERVWASSVEARYGDRLVDRLVGHGSSVVSCPGKSLRRTRSPA